MTDVPQWAVERGREIVAAVLEGSAGAYSIKQTPEETAAELVAFVARALAEAAKPKWQPIETAPKDTVVLTDCGTAMHYDGQWFLCTAGGAIPSCADWGHEASEISPSVWAPLPGAPEVG